MNLRYLLKIKKTRNKLYFLIIFLGFVLPHRLLAIAKNSNSLEINQSQCSNKKIDFEIGIEKTNLNETGKTLALDNSALMEYKIKISEIFSPYKNNPNSQHCVITPDKINLIFSEKKKETRNNSIPSCELNFKFPDKTPYLIFDLITFRTDLKDELCNSKQRKRVVSNKTPSPIQAPPEGSENLQSNVNPEVLKSKPKATEEASRPNEARTEASASCNDCNRRSNDDSISKTRSSSELINNHLNQKINEKYACKPKGIVKPMSEAEIMNYVRSGKMRKLIENYTALAQPALTRAHLALVKPGKENKAKEILEEFGAFNKVPLKKLDKLDLFKTQSQHLCYSFIKAALSGDYSVLRNRDLGNTNLLNEMCEVDQTVGQGDLAHSHSGWRTNNYPFSALAAGNSEPELKDRGFINILDSKYGIKSQFLNKDGTVNEQSLPDGAVIVYHCNDNRLLKQAYGFKNPYKGGPPNGVGGPKCKYGDIALKDSHTYLRDFSTQTPAGVNNKRVVVGAYILPSSG